MDVLFSPRIDRGDPTTMQGQQEATTSDQAANQARSGTNSGPRVGGLDDDGVPWVGGSNFPGKKNEEPHDVLCCHPKNQASDLLQCLS